MNIANKLSMIYRLKFKTIDDPPNISKEYLRMGKKMKIRSGYFQECLTNHLG